MAARIDAESLRGGNSLGVRPLDNRETLEQLGSFLRPVSDLVVVASHMGLDQTRTSPPRTSRQNDELVVEGVNHHLRRAPPHVSTPKSCASTSFGHPMLLVQLRRLRQVLGRLTSRSTSARPGAMRPSGATSPPSPSTTSRSLRRRPGRDPCPNPGGPRGHRVAHALAKSSTR